jgi:hypothetical protein
MPGPSARSADTTRGMEAPYLYHGIHDMPATEKVSYTLTPETVAQINDLARLWSAAKPLPKSQVIAEAVKRTWEVETYKAEVAAKWKTKKKS